MAEEKDSLSKSKLNLPDSDVAAKAAAAKTALERAVAASKDLADKAAAGREAKVSKGEVLVQSLRVRKEPNTTSSLVGGLVAGNEVTIYETWTDGKDTWAKIGPDQWAAMIYNGETYIKTT